MDIDSDHEWEQVGRASRRRQSPSGDMATDAVGSQPPPQSTAEEAQDVFKLVDFRSLLQPKPFTGQRKDFASFRRDLENSLIPLGIDHYLRAAVNEPQAPPLSIMTAQQRQLARLLYSILAALVRGTGEAELMVESVSDKNGFAAWRRLVHGLEDVHSIDRQTAVYAGLLNPHWVDSEWERQWLSWEVALSRYTLDTGKQVDDHTKAATVLRCAPKRIKDFIRICPRELTSSYSTLRDALINYLAKEKEYDLTGDRRSMDEEAAPPRPDASGSIAILDTTPNGKGKAKGKGKGKLDQQMNDLRRQLAQLQEQLQQLLVRQGPPGFSTSVSSMPPHSTAYAKAKAFAAPSQMLCFRCNQPGHRAAECLADLEESLMGLHIADATPEEARYVEEILEDERALAMRKCQN